uniref:DB domain-containing protein n=1 Tax=Caenorhabditis tropicalis TaxID=1561998 RepID=A0A1I7TUW9_9PELO
MKVSFLFVIHNANVAHISLFYSVLMLHYLNTCGPKNQTVQLMWDCASSRADHTECCKKNNVLPACLPYCAAQGTVPNEQVTHVFCMQNFNNIRDCFRSHLDKRPNIFGDN